MRLVRGFGRRILSGFLPIFGAILLDGRPACFRDAILRNHIFGPSRGEVLLYGAFPGRLRVFFLREIGKSVRLFRNVFLCVWGHGIRPGVFGFRPVS